MHTSGRARILRAPLRAFSSAHSPRLTGPHFGGILPQNPERRAGIKIKNKNKIKIKSRSGAASLSVASSPELRSAGMHVLATRPARAVRGAEHRSQCRKMPEGARRWIAALAQQYMDVLSARPGAGEKHRALGRADARPGTAFGARLFWLLFVAMTKVTVSPEGRDEALLLKQERSKIKMDSGFRRNDEPKIGETNASENDPERSVSDRQRSDRSRAPADGQRAKNSEARRQSVPCS